MPPRALEPDEQRCANPDCDGVPVVVPGSHNRHGKHQPWTIRDIVCPHCGWRWETEERIRPGTIQRSLFDSVATDSQQCS